MSDSATVVLRAEKLVAGGDALGHLDDGRVVFISGALPGETVRAALKQSKTSFAKAQTIEVLESSAERVATACPHLAEGCGGCSWMHIEPVAQHDFKVELVSESLGRIAKMSNADIRRGSAIGAVGTRNVMRFAVNDDGRLGLRAAASNTIVPIEHCMVAAETINNVLGSSGWTPGTEVVMHANADSVAVSTDSRVPEEVRELVRSGEFGFTTQEVLGTQLRVDAESFYQGCEGADAILVEAVSRAAGDEYLNGSHGPVVDAYGGVGLFAATLVSPETECVLVEMAPSAIDDARINLSGRNVSVVESKMEDWIPVRAGLVIADPSRRGLGADAVSVIAGTGAKRVVLVSCDVAAGARDIALLVAQGYQLIYTEVLDLFPNTFHVEMVSRLDLRSAGDTV